MKSQKKVISIFLIASILVLSVVVPTSAAPSESYTTHQTFILDGAYLTAITNNSPYFSAFTEKILVPYHLSLHGNYKEAKAEFEDCVEYIEYELEYFNSYSKSLLKSLSSNTKDILNIINFYINVMFAQSETLLNTLADYINISQQSDNAEALDDTLQAFFATRDELENNVFLFQYLKDSITVAYVYAYAHPDNTALENRTYILNRIQEPFLDSYDPYGFYSKNKNELDQEYDFDAITEVIIMEVVEQSAVSDAEAVEAQDAPYAEADTSKEDDVSIVYTTTPINTAVAFMTVPKEDIYNGGAYKVGVDIPVGEYIIIPNYLTTYFSVKDANNDLLANGFFGGSYYITLDIGQYLMIDDGFAIPASKYNVAAYDYSVITPGMYKVGTDIPVGEYKLTTMDDNGYFCLYDNSTTNRRILSNDFFDKSSYVNTKCGDYLYLDCFACFIDPNTQSTNTNTNIVSSSPTKKTSEDTDYTNKTSIPSVVYWVSEGKVYHKSMSCPTLDRSTNIRSGSISQSNKSSCCKVCG